MILVSGYKNELGDVPMNSKSRITAIGTYVPDQILSNNDLEKIGN